MRRIDIRTSSGEYPIILGKNIISQLKEYISDYDKILLLSNEDIGNIYFKRVLQELKDERIRVFTIPEGESFKNLETLSTIYDYMAKENFSRKSLIISLGGGVVCDIGGFVGATYMRGIDFIQIPTSLLAQVDASIGGKTGVDTQYGKNLIGAFKQPKAVFIDVSFLSTLPKEQFSSGMAEVIKHSLIIENKEYFEFLKVKREKIISLDSDNLIEMIAKSCDIKREIVERDEFEKGDRALLNLGHTYGHSIEKLFNFKGMTHGEGVAKGIIFELELSKILNEIDEDRIEEIKDIFKSYGLDPNPIYYPEEIILEIMKKDKKNSFDKINFILFSKEMKVYRDSVEIKYILEVNNLFSPRYIKGIIDIGTNSCRLFLAQVFQGEEIKIEREISKDVEIVKLGEDVNKNGYLKKEAISRTVECLKRYKKKADSYGVKELVAFATSATRDSKNKDEFLNQVKEIGIDIKCISGDREAQLNFLGNSIVFEERILVLDIGGGSTEFTLGEKGEIEFVKSINIGAVRGTERFFSTQNYTDESIEECREWVKDMISEVKFLKNKNFTLVGVAGTATTQISVQKQMGVYDSSKVHMSEIRLEELRENLKLFLECSVEKRKHIVGLEEKRADVIIAGTIILITIMEELGVNKMIVSESDNLNGAMISKSI